MANHSDRAKKNMTSQMKSQLDFLENNLVDKQKSLDRNKKWFSKLPGFKWTINNQIQGLIKVRKDIDELKSQIIQMQKDGKINVIIDDV